MDKKILILLPIWGRKNITRVCLDSLKELQKSYNIEVLCVVSEVWAKIDAFERGFKYVQVSNDDLGVKMNTGVKESLKYDYDYLMNLGSDDIINERLFDVYKDSFDKGLEMFGITKATFIDIESKRVKDCDYKAMIGAGRCIAKSRILKDVIVDGESIMYDKGIKRGLDFNSMFKFKCSMSELATEGCLIWDIKSDENIWVYDNIGGTDIGFDEAVKEMKTKDIDAILEL